MGLEHLLLAERVADSVVLAFDEEHGPFRLTYRLAWDEAWRSQSAALRGFVEALGSHLAGHDSLTLTRQQLGQCEPAGAEAAAKFGD